MPKALVTMILGGLFALSLGGCRAEGDRLSSRQHAIAENTASRSEFVMPDEKSLRESLTPLQYRVTRENGTEPAFQNEFWDHQGAGIYVDIVSGEALFSSLDKYDSGSGWPSFTQPIAGAGIVEKQDLSQGMVRTEVRSNTADSHLGHLFPDGPGDRGGLRYCINSAALRFVPLAEMAAQGYSKYLNRFAEAGLYDGPVGAGESVFLAGGCFWGMEEIIRAIPGVRDTLVGYTGGDLPNPTYEDVKKGATGHAESIKVLFDPSVLSFETLLRDWFFKMHDPTTLNRQGNDIGSQYRSAIFYGSEQQRQTAEAVIEEVDASGNWQNPVVTEVAAAGDFWAAETYHQDYLQKYPDGYTCHWLRDF